MANEVFHAPISVLGAGTADATASVSTAIDQAMGSGRLLLFGPGIYNVTEINKILSADLEVEMMAGAVIKGKAGFATPVLILDGTTTRGSLRWRGGTIDNSLRTFVGAEQAGTALSIKRFDNFSIEGVKFKGGADWPDNVGDSGITVLQCNRGTISNCVFIGQPDCGIYLSGGNLNDATDDQGDIVITGNHFFKCSLPVAIKRQNPRTIVSGNTFLDNYAGVAFLEASTIVLPGRQGTVIGNTFKRTQTRAIEIRVYGGVVVTGNLIEDFGRDRSNAAVNGWAIRILGGRQNLITGNVIRSLEWANHNALVAFDTLNLTIDSVLYTAGDNSFLGNAIHDVWLVAKETTTDPNVYDNRMTGYTTAFSALNATSLFTYLDDVEQARTVFGVTEMFRVNSANVFTRNLRFFETLTTAGAPASFAANRYLPVKDASGATFYIPLATATW